MKGESMRKSILSVMLLGAVLVGSTVSAASPQSYEATYAVSGEATGKMLKKLICSDSGATCEITSHTTVHKAFFHKDIHRTADLSITGNDVTQVSMAKSEGDDTATPATLSSGQYGALGALFTVRFQLMHALPLIPLQFIGKDSQVSTMTFSAEKTLVSIKTPAGDFDTVKVVGSNANKAGVIYYLDPTQAYMMVKAETIENDQAVLTVLLTSEGEASTEESTK
jgi:hypothetical protein